MEPAIGASPQKTQQAIFMGYGILLDSKLVYSLLNRTNKNRSLCEVVRNRDYPKGDLCFWVQGVGTPTVTQRITG